MVVVAVWLGLADLVGLELRAAVVGSLSFWPGWMIESDFRPFALTRDSGVVPTLRAMRVKLSPAFTV